MVGSDTGDNLSDAMFYMNEYSFSKREGYQVAFK